MWLHVHSAPCAYVSEGCAACLESVAGQRAPTVPVASAVDCARLEIGLAVSIETRPELRGVSNAGGTQRSTQSALRVQFGRGGGIEPTKVAGHLTHLEVKKSEERGRRGGGNFR
jgi:hypothetical protein